MTDSATFTTPEASDEDLGDLALEVLPGDGSMMGNLSAGEAVIKSGKSLTWYSFRHTWITFALERGVPIATVCNNCDTSIEYIQQHYFHYDATRGTGALATGRQEFRRRKITPRLARQDPKD